MRSCQHGKVIPTSSCNSLPYMVQDKRSLTDVLQSIHVNRVHTVHDALAALDAQALSMQVCTVKCFLFDTRSSGKAGSQKSAICAGIGESECGLSAKIVDSRLSIGLDYSHIGCWRDSAKSWACIDVCTRPHAKVHGYLLHCSNLVHQPYGGKRHKP